MYAINNKRHLSFCLNVFQLDSLEKIFQTLANECRTIKEHQCPNNDFGLGMWFSAQVIEELQNPEKLAKLKSILIREGIIYIYLEYFPLRQFSSSSR